MNFVKTHKRSLLQAVAVFALVALTLAFPGYIDPHALAAAPLLFAGTMLDVFQTNNAFNMTSLTMAINKEPFVPGRAGQLINWNPSGVTTLTMMIEERNGVLTIINPSPRGGVGDTVDKEKRVIRPIMIPHYQRNDGVYADEVQGIREFGQEQSVETLQNVIQARLAKHARDFDLTLEYQRVGALKGVILNGDTTTLLDLFTLFGVTQEAEVDFDLDNATPASGALRKVCAGVTRKIADNMGGEAFFGVHAICGDAFFDDLLGHVEVRASYLGYDMAAVLRNGYVYPNNEQKVYGAFEFGGIVWENYKGTVNGSKIVDTDKCHIFPMGAPDLFQTKFGPADYMETVNTVGLPRYAKQFLMPNDKGVNLEMQSNMISFCTRPKTLMKGKRT